VQGGMISEAQIVAKPDNAGRGRWARHQVVNSESGRRFARTRHLQLYAG
jgi:hypothetical protein